MKNVLIFLGLKFHIIQYKWGRKLFKGSYYLIDAGQLRMGVFWSNDRITSAGSIVLNEEYY